MIGTSFQDQAFDWRMYRQRVCSAAGLPDFSSRAHWEAAYQEQEQGGGSSSSAAVSEWYCQYDDLREVLQRHCPPSSTASVLIPGQHGVCAPLLPVLSAATAAAHSTGRRRLC